MKLRYTSLATASILGGLLLATAPGAAESLAGKVGDKRSIVFFSPGEEGNCKQAYQAYVAAAGHSAYASTIKGRSVQYSICGVHLNAPSQEKAEQVALRNCEGGLRKYKLRTLGRCSIMVSK